MDCNNSGVTAINTFVAGSSFSITPPRDKWMMRKYTAMKRSLLFYHHHHWQWMRRALAEYNKLLRILLSSGTRDVLWRLRCRICIYDEWGRSWPIEQALDCVGIYIKLARLPWSAIMWTVLGVSGLETVWSIYSSGSPPHPYGTHGHYT